MKKEAGNRINKKGIALETLAYWLIAVAILVLMIIGYMILSGKGGVALSYVEKLFRFGQ